MDVYFPLSKRSRTSASGERFEQKKPSIEVLPDECLFEIFRWLRGGRERSSCACVSKRWLILVSNICKYEIRDNNIIQALNPKDESTSKKGGIVSEVEHNDVDSDGYFTRSLEGKKATDGGLAAIAVGTASRGGLGKLFIRGSNSWNRVTTVGLRAISRGCPSLRVLSLWNLSSIGDEGLCEIANGCHRLVTLDLCHCPAVTDKSLLAIAKGCPKLNDLTIESCANVGNEGLLALACCCTNLKSVSIKNCPLVGDQGVASLLSSASYSLTKLKLQALNITDEMFSVIGHYGKSVTDLSLTSLPNVSDKGFWIMGNSQGLQKLKSFTIASCLGLTDRGLEAVGKGCVNLKQFYLFKCDLLSDKGLVSFAKVAGSLESLQLEDCHRITQIGLFCSLLNCSAKLKVISLVNCLGVMDLTTGLPPLSPCESLQSLSIRNCPGFSDSSLAVLGKLCPQLQHVELRGLHGITDAGFLQLLESCNAGLVKVNLKDCVNLSDKGVCRLTNLHRWTLETLNLDGCKISDASLFAIAENCRLLGDLDVSKCAITDSGIAALAHSDLINVQILSVSGCSMVSDKSLPSLRNLGKTLLGLNLQQCKAISRSAIGLLVQQLWRCNILF
ncbi:hypothetical protein CXB51_018456 [Gossypium anomalum]|uniref:F-box domain-containing protein n=1 Tax=Gossypium anomalum TaxID=47600 RepID=A0A8J5YVN9_9ROSI|nr:hypothetical protein CXB51_018456 [Gossypium anomalum]